MATSSSKIRNALATSSSKIGDAVGRVAMRRSTVNGQVEKEFNFIMFIRALFAPISLLLCAFVLLGWLVANQQLTAADYSYIAGDACDVQPGASNLVGADNATLDCVQAIIESGNRGTLISFFDFYVFALLSYVYMLHVIAENYTTQDFTRYVLRCVTIIIVIAECAWLFSNYFALRAFLGNGKGWQWDAGYTPPAGVPSGPISRENLLDFNNLVFSEQLGYENMVKFAISGRIFVALLVALVVLVDQFFVKSVGSRRPKSRRDLTSDENATNRFVVVTHSIYMTVFTICQISCALLPGWLLWILPPATALQFSYLVGADCDGVSGKASSPQLWHELCGIDGVRIAAAWKDLADNCPLDIEGDSVPDGPWIGAVCPIQSNVTMYTNETAHTPTCAALSDASCMQNCVATFAKKYEAEAAQSFYTFYFSSLFFTLLTLDEMIGLIAVRSRARAGRGRAILAVLLIFEIFFLFYSILYRGGITHFGSYGDCMYTLETHNIFQFRRDELMWALLTVRGILTPAAVLILYFMPQSYMQMPKVVQEDEIGRSQALRDFSKAAANARGAASITCANGPVPESEAEAV